METRLKEGQVRAGASFGSAGKISENDRTPRELKMDPGPHGQSQACQNVVLVVDDDDDVLLVTKMMLERNGFEAVTANSGSAGIDIFTCRCKEIALAVVDFSMPSMGGDQVVGVMREIDPSVPIILSSGLDEQEIEQYSKDLDLAGWVKKPFSFKTLIDRVNRAVFPAPAALGV